MVHRCTRGRPCRITCVLVAVALSTTVGHAASARPRQPVDFLRKLVRAFAGWHHDRAAAAAEAGREKAPVPTPFVAPAAGVVDASARLVHMRSGDALQLGVTAGLGGGVFGEVVHPIIRRDTEGFGDLALRGGIAVQGATAALRLAIATAVPTGADVAPSAADDLRTVAREQALVDLALARRVYARRADTVLEAWVWAHGAARWGDGARAVQTAAGTALSCSGARWSVALIVEAGAWQRYLPGVADDRLTATGEVSLWVGYRSLAIGLGGERPTAAQGAGGRAALFLQVGVRTVLRRTQSFSHWP